MKRISLMTLVLALSTSVMAYKKTGYILNLRQDEEGVNIILEANDTKKTITTHYLTNQSVQFVDSLTELQAAKENKTLIELELNDKNPSQILKLEIKK